MTGFLFAFCMCVSLDFNSELFLVPYLCICLSAPRIPIDGLFFFLARACGPELLVDYSDRRIMFLLRIANHMVMDSRCRGGIVHIRGGCSRALLRTARKFHGALAVSCKYFKQSKWPNLAAAITRNFVIFIILTLNKIFEYVEMTIFSRPRGSSRTPRHFDFFA